jgi:3-(3-hydroxy-phenyl)propionate hydroxylase
MQPLAQILLPVPFECLTAFAKTMIETIESGYDLPVFPYETPRDFDAMPAQHPIVIVGGGLAGLTLAADLSVRGVPFVLLDEDDTVGVRGASSRGVVYAQKSLEIFARLGIYERIFEKGVAWSVGKSLMGHSDVIYQFDAAVNSPSMQSPFLNIQQFYIEWYLVDRIIELGVGELRWRNKVVGVDARDDGTTLDVETPDGVYQIDAQWVVDCSGLASPVREKVGLPTYPEKGTERWCISDVRFTKQLPLERWTWVEAPVNDQRAVWQHPMADGVWRIDFQMELDADVDYISRPDVCKERVQRLLGDDVEFELVWVGPWASRTHLLDNFRHQRILFAGDSAHVFPPLGARGGNSGIQDADNLGWKLARVVQGQAPSSLMDSYNAERRPSAIHNTELATRSVRFLSPVSPGQKQLRRAAMALAREHAFAQSLINTGRLSVAFAYSDSPLSFGAGESIPNVALNGHDESVRSLADLARAGKLIVFVSDHDPVPDVLGQETVIRIGGDHGPGVDVADADGTLAQVLGLRRGELVIVRPDLHVMARVAVDDAARLADVLKPLRGSL